MARPGGKEVGRLRIRVLPDATRFRNDLKLALERAEQSMSANIAITANTKPFELEAKKLIKKWSGQEVDLNASLDSKVFSARMRVITRPRFVTIALRLSKTSVAKIGSAIAALSGARLAGDFIEGLGRRLENLDRALPKITAVALGVASLGAAGLDALHGLGAVVVQLGQLVPLVALLPAFATSAAIGLTAVILALKDAPAVLGSTLTAYKSLQGIVSDNFWERAAGPIRELLTGLLPSVKSGFAGVGKSLGSTFAGIATTLRDRLAGGALDGIFANITAGMDAAIPGLNAFASAFSSLLATGSKFLPVFGGWITRIGEQFNGWLAGVTASGELDRMIEAAISLLQSLGSSLVSIGSILSGVFNAGGGDAIGGLAAGLAAMAEVINSPAFQSTLGTIFAGAEAGAAGLGAALGPIGAMFQTLAPVIAEILSTSGVALGQFLSQMADALSQPAFSEGLSGLFSGLQAGLAAIGPSLPAIAAAFGSLMQFAGDLAATLGPVLGVVLAELAPIITDVLTAITPLLPILGTAFVSIVKALAPILATVADLFVQLLPPLMPLVESLLPPIVKLIEALAPLFAQMIPPIVKIVTILADLLLPILGPLLELLSGPIASAILQPIVAVLQILAGVLEFLSPQLTMLGEIFSAVIKTIVAMMKGDFASIGKIWSDAWSNIQGAFEDAWNGIVEFGKSAWNGLMDGLSSFINGAIDAVNGLTAGINLMLDGVRAISGGAIDLHIGKIPHIKIPHLAVGADILATPGGVLARLGEGGRSERVIDRGLGNRSLALQNALSERILAMFERGASSAGHTWQLFGVTDPDDLFAKFVRRLDDREA